jgi:hypothetical protein
LQQLQLSRGAVAAVGVLQPLQVPQDEGSLLSHDELIAGAY